MQYFFQQLLQYRWSICLGILMFVLCLLIASFGLAITLVVVLLTALAVFVGFLKDRKLNISELLKNIK